MKASKPKNEVQRIKVLWQYNVLDTLPEQVFDDLTSLAALICDAPISLISLVDEDRQWFKSKVGLSLSESSRDVSICAHAIMQDGLFIVPDATKDRRFKNNPFVVSAPKIRFYAGAPLVSPDGLALGTLCVIDKVPRKLTETQKKALRVLSRLVMTQLNFRRQTHSAGPDCKECEQLKQDLKKARAEIVQLRRRGTSGRVRRKARTNRR
jgi:GAF domain-containing protein